MLRKNVLDQRVAIRIRYTYSTSPGTGLSTQMPASSMSPYGPVIMACNTYIPCPIDLLLRKADRAYP